MPRTTVTIAKWTKPILPTSLQSLQTTTAKTKPTLHGIGPSCASAKSGFDAFAAEIRQAFDNAAPTGEELHELMAYYNYDDGAGLPAWVVAHPACTLATAQQVYWLCHPAYFYQDYGSPQNTPEGIGYDIAQLIVAIEEKARSGGFVESPGQTAELRGDESIAEAIACAPLDKIPAALWQGLA